jgi:pimeloyl-ACP methyl ester carboxylesterase
LAFQLSNLPGFVVIRFDKPGAGDSEGGPCRDLDFEGELAAARAVLTTAMRRADVDSTRVFLIGQSYAGGILPLVAHQHHVAGYIVISSWYGSWMDRLLAFEQRERELRGMKRETIERQLGMLRRLYGEYLVGRRTPGEVLAGRPELAEVWKDEPDHQYGRPARFFQQLQDLDLRAAWQTVNVPALIVYGEYDWLMRREDHVALADALNRRHPGTATLVVVPKMGHSLFVHPTIEQAHRDYWSGTFPNDLEPRIAAWLAANSDR